MPEVCVWSRMLNACENVLVYNLTSFGVPKTCLNCKTSGNIQELPERCDVTGSGGLEDLSEVSLTSLVLEVCENCLKCVTSWLLWACEQYHPRYHGLLGGGGDA